jgi:CRP/FNR family transcriptional regulator, anaerobic regulatory protein
MEELLAFLQSIYPLSPGLIEHLEKIIRYRKVKKGEILLRPGQISKYIYFVKKGMLRAYYDKDGVDVSAWFMDEGKLVVSITSFYDQVPSFETMHALEDCELFCISFDELEEVYQKFTEFNTVGRKLITRYLINWDRQIYGLRMNDATTRLAWLLEYHPDWLLRVQQNYLASFLDITDVRLSQIKGKITNTKKGR